MDTQQILAEAKRILLNKKIVQVRYLTDEEQGAFKWRYKGIVFQLDDDTLLIPSMDNEGNEAGALYHFNGDNNGCIPSI
jgi:hypothetical protein